MASPSQSQQSNGHISPPAPSTNTTTQPTSQLAEPQLPPIATAAASTSATKSAADPAVPLTSLTDSGDSKRPRDARLLHLVLSAQGINSYQERVPLQLLDFAYRYTSSVLGDAVRLAGEGYTGAERTGGRGRNEGGENSIGVTALRQAIASRQDFGFQGGYLAKEFMLEQAAERNRVGLPKVERDGGGGGLVLPEEKFCLTGIGWGLKETWEESESEGEGEGVREVRMGGVDAPVEEEREDEDEEGAGRMEDVFGEDGGGDGGDVDMSGN